MNILFEKARQLLADESTHVGSEYMYHPLVEAWEICNQLWDNLPETFNKEDHNYS